MPVAGSDDSIGMNASLCWARALTQKGPAVLACLVGPCTGRQWLSAHVAPIQPYPGTERRGCSRCEWRRDRPGLQKNRPRLILGTRTARHRPARHVHGLGSQRLGKGGPQLRQSHSVPCLPPSSALQSQSRIAKPVHRIESWPGALPAVASCSCIQGLIFAGTA